MPLKLMYITNDPGIALIAERSGVDRIFIDLEITGKNRRQKGKDTVISGHKPEEISGVKDVLKSAELLVRVNPLHQDSKREIEEVIKQGADIVMLPFFKTPEEVAAFVGHVGKNARTCLLCETPEAVEKMDEILQIQGIDSIHIGLNDLHMGYGMKFMFELLADGTVEMLCNKFRNRSIPYGFGGIARLGQGALPAEYIIAEHYRLGSRVAILSRSFCNITETNDISNIESIFKQGVSEIRRFESSLEDRKEDYFSNNRREIIERVSQITRSLH